MMVLQGGSVKGAAEDEPISILANKKQTALYKLEVTSKFRDEKITLFYTNQESMLRWRKALLQATGDYKINDYYEFSEFVYFLGKELGEGRRCKVIKGTNKLSKQEVAIKCLYK